MYAIACSRGSDLAKRRPIKELSSASPSAHSCTCATQRSSPIDAGSIHPKPDQRRHADKIKINATVVLKGLRPSPTWHDVCDCRFKGKLTQGPAVSVADRHHSLRRGILTMTRSAYVQVRCAVVALWSERHQRYAAKTGPETSNLTQNSGFAGSSFLVGA